MLIVVADDHRLLREMLIDNLAHFDNGETPEVLEVASFGELKKVDLRRQPDLVLLDFNMPGSLGIESIRDVVARYAPTPVLVLSGAVEPAVAMECVKVGTAGFLPKTVSRAALISALRVVLDGEKYIHAFAVPDLNRATQPLHENASPADPRPPHFSDRESQMIELLIGGKTNKHIARELGLKEMTVKTHVRNIYKKLGAVNRADAVRKVLQRRKD